MPYKYEIVRFYDDGSSEIWDDAKTLREAEAICRDLDSNDYLYTNADAPYKHRIYEVKRRLVSQAERKRRAR